jgi:hypothetical protein
MKKIIRLTESDLTRLVKRTIREMRFSDDKEFDSENELELEDFSNMEPNEIVDRLIHYFRKVSKSDNMTSNLSFNIQLYPEYYDHTGEEVDRYVLRMWDGSRRVLPTGRKPLKIFIEKDKYEELRSIIENNFGFDDYDEDGGVSKWSQD